MLHAIALLALALTFLEPLIPARADPLPEIVLRADDTVIDRSCRIVIPPGTVIRDAAGDGVVRIRASGITVEFAPGSVLRGGEADAAPDTFTGVGVRIEGATDVTIRNLHLEGFKVGLWATDADGLTLENSRADNLWRHRLKSTPAAEDSSDWLWPHRNDDREWLTNYGAAFAIERSADITVRRCTVRRGQNGLILDRVTGGRVYDNDFSFLSGWGLAMWRSSRNTISRNAMDFCVRGYSHGVYNRGQDSAGILMFEQCNENTIAENSATHGGDGFFGFGGREALGEAPPPSPPPGGFDYTRLGCNDNVLIGNDFSYAPAHGIEMTFSFGNKFIGNRLAENAICGVWGGYSQETLILGNTIVGNGLPGHSEGGGVNIEHGHANLIAHNIFKNNTVGVALWWDNDEGLFRTPWAKVNHKGSSDNRINFNTFEGNAADARLRRTTGTAFFGNTAAAGLRIDADEHSPFERDDGVVDLALEYEAAAFGDSRPVGARPHLRGRDKIIMGEWGPWDHESPLVRPAARSGASHAYEVFGAGGGVSASTAAEGVRIRVDPIDGLDGSRIHIKSDGSSGVTRYDVAVSAPALPAGGVRLAGTIVAAEWDVRFFPWMTDPREDLAAWRAESLAESAVRVTVPAIELRFANAGPGALPLLRDQREKAPWRDRFGTIATTTLHLPAGRYRFTTLSDDGVRLTASRPSTPDLAVTIVENWTWHGPTRDVGLYTHLSDGPVTLTLEHFEIDGYAVLELTIERLDAPGR